MIARADAVGQTLAAVGDALVITATGMISREAFVAHDRPENFYTIGSMGLVASIGLGVALAQPARRVVVFDGDGSVLMAMGTLAMIGERQPENLSHVVFDNQTYGSTGDQRSISDTTPLEKVARACGYRWVEKLDGNSPLEPYLGKLTSEPGPGFLLIKVAPGNVQRIARVQHDPEWIAERFRKAAQAAG